MTVTVKYGKGYEAAWITFRGSPSQIKSDLVQTFGLEGQDDLNLGSVVLNAQSVAHALHNTGTVLGGTVVGTGKAKGDKPASSEQAGGDPWAQAEEPADPYEGVKALIAATTTVDELKRLYAETPEIATTPEVLAEWKARGKALTAAQS